MPSPQALGISPSAVVRVSPTSRGIQMAKAFARPSTAKALGAHPPAAHRVVSASQVAHPVGYATPHGAIHGGGHVHGPR
jgi:hypothetical protein